MTSDGNHAPWQRAESPFTAAVMAGRWIRTAAVDDERGRHWRANPDPRRDSARSGRSSSLYAGAAGIVLFFIELATVTGHEAYLDDAAEGARFLASTWEEETDFSLYHGLAGVVFALAEASWATGDERFAAAARAGADRIVRGMRGSGDGAGWTGDPAQSGDGGIILGLLHASGILGVPAYQDVAVEAGAAIAARAVPGHRFGAEGCPGLPIDAVTPGFLSGTAGTAFLLARLYGVTRDRLFLDAAQRGADFVRTVSTVTDDHALVPHHVPQGRELHYLGLCSGSAGVARMFYELHRVTGDPGDLEWVERLARGIVCSGIPYRQTPGFWNVACQCCGTAGLLELFIGLWAATGAQPYLDFAGILADNLIGRATGHDDTGYRWYQAYRRLRPWEVTADTGYMIGAAGIGSALLRAEVAAAVGEPRRLILLPDNPFPAIPLPASALRRSP
ncbi:lanthionine synthetase LanC family protein [Sphaerisporangium sp. TRM90804]|uniref:lanthionine synthetase LanC family protein n=1 Tax=Sphaerisporangium sp. TRM90804 TaxID=3031113 RepID=UPI00244887E1|nr:lanthionine synthetase LanC family protein [Sphaerisporangium sp. TRM90804]MDH2426264.1 lanthionine synthetase LanC family protein [Sphaerisporangium sp. TRM90804]